MLGQHVVVSLLVLRLAVVAAQSPIKVFLLSGQSNMVGHGAIQHAAILARQSDEFMHCFDVSCSVYVSYFDKIGCLNKQAYSDDHIMFGPEIGIGCALKNYMTDANSDETILLLKAAWGGKNLAVDFRPDQGNYTDVDASKYGVSYDLMMNEFNTKLSNISAIVPGYDNSLGYELAGFVWFQGWNDVVIKRYAAEYEHNLGNFVDRVRSDLQVPNMPFLIGELGQHGVEETNTEVLQFRESQKQVAHTRSNTYYVPTARFVVLNDTEYEDIYHYYGRADIFLNIGLAFGQLLVLLMKL